METEAYNILRAICHFLDGLFFGYGIITLLALLIFLFYKKRELRTFINYAVHVARNLAIVYFILYSISLVIYYSSKEFDFFNERATGPYALTYWIMLLRPLIFCGILQLFWIKKLANTLRYVGLITCVVLFVSLFSGSVFERLVIITAAYNRDYFLEESQFNTDLIIIVSSYIIEKTVLFCALVFTIWAINREPKLK